MTPQQIIEEFEGYSLAEQASLMSKLFRVMQETIENEGKNSEKIEIDERVDAINRLYGIAAVKGKSAPTDEEIKEDYTNYLMEKYS